MKRPAKHTAKLPNARQLARLVRVKESGTKRLMRDPVTGATFTQYAVQTARNGGVTPAQAAALRKAKLPVAKSTVWLAKNLGKQAGGFEKALRSTNFKNAERQIRGIRSDLSALKNRQSSYAQDITPDEAAFIERGLDAAGLTDDVFGEPIFAGETIQDRIRALEGDLYDLLLEYGLITQEQYDSYSGEGE